MTRVAASTFIHAKNSCCSCDTITTFSVGDLMNRIAVNLFVFGSTLILLAGTVLAEQTSDAATKPTLEIHQPNSADLGGSPPFELKESLVAWLADVASKDESFIEEKLRLNRNLETKRCVSEIVFSYVRPNKSLILARCETEWRRFIRQPTWLKIEKENEAGNRDEKIEISTVLALSKDVKSGEFIRKTDLVKKEIKVLSFSPFILSSDLEDSLIASRDLQANIPLSTTDVLIGQQVLTAITTIPSGSTLSESLMMMDVRHKNVPDDAVKIATGWNFMETNKTIMPGEIIRERHLRKSKLVRRQDPVTLVNRGPAIEIITSGTALQDGYYGQSIKVINTESGRRVVGIIVGRGKVEVNTVN